VGTACQIPSICLPVSCLESCRAIPLLRSYTYSCTEAMLGVRNRVQLNRAAALRNCNCARTRQPSRGKSFGKTLRIRMLAAGPRFSSQLPNYPQEALASAKWIYSNANYRFRSLELVSEDNVLQEIFSEPGRFDEMTVHLRA
jgi:hypothetical protein